MTEKSAQLGMNRTGMDLSPIEGKQIVEGAREGKPSSKGDRFTQNELKIPYLQQNTPVGSVPPPGNLKGVVKTALNMLQGKQASVLLDKLGERLAFERTGTRLYEALISKAEVVGGNGVGPSLKELKTIHDEELRHFHLVKGYIEQLGGDPTTMTPAADVAGVASCGLVKVIADPRTTVPQSLEAILIAELTDNDGWSALIRLAEGFGQSDMAADFRQALTAEERHLLKVRGWLSASVKTEAGVG